MGAQFYGPGDREAFGVIVPFDMELDSELWRWVPTDVDMSITRTPYVDDAVTVGFIQEISRASDLRASALSLTAGRASAVVYACASGSFIGGAAGEGILRETILAAGAQSAATTSGAFVEALAHLNIDRVSVATPYVLDLSRYLDKFLGEYGVSVVRHAALGYDRKIWAVPYQVTADLIREVDDPDSEAILVSCSNLPTYDVIAPLEQELGKPIITANQATIWAALRQLGRLAVGPGQALLHEPGTIRMLPSAHGQEEDPGETSTEQAETIA